MAATAAGLEVRPGDALMMVDQDPVLEDLLHVDVQMVFVIPVSATITSVVILIQIPCVHLPMTAEMIMAADQNDISNMLILSVSTIPAISQTERVPIILQPIM